MSKIIYIYNPETYLINTRKGYNYDLENKKNFDIHMYKSE